MGIYRHTHIVAYSFRSAIASIHRAAEFHHVCECDTRISSCRLRLASIDRKEFVASDSVIVRIRSRATTSNPRMDCVCAAGSAAATGTSDSPKHVFGTAKLRISGAWFQPVTKSRCRGVVRTRCQGAGAQLRERFGILTLRHFAAMFELPKFRSSALFMSFA